MKLSSRKRKRCSEVRKRCSVVDVRRDRLSEMPDEVIVHILSCMPTLYAVRTVLLRRFGNLWTLVPTLKFDNYLGNHRNFARFNIFIRNVLMLHKRLSIDTFHLRTTDLEYFEEKDVDDVKIWLRFALGRQAKEIKFYTICDDPFLPNLISQSLVRLKLHGCRIDPKLQVNLGSLKKLSFKSVSMREKAFQQFISGCPSLQELRIVNPYSIKKLSFGAPNIDTLSLVQKGEHELEGPLLLDVPNLKSLHLNMYPLPIITDVSSLRVLHLKGLVSESDAFDCDEGYYTMLTMFLGKFKDVQVFRLSDEALEPFLNAVQHLYLSQNRWKCLVLDIKVLSNKDCLVGIYQLMRTLKHLEELIIDYSQDRSFNSFNCHSKGASTALLPVEISSSCVMPKLKSVTFHGYAKRWDRWLQLFQFLLKSAVCLDKLVILPSKYHKLSAAKELEIVKRVSSFHRSSPDASVLFR